jgi:hypothetical protein
VLATLQSSKQKQAGASRPAGQTGLLSKIFACFAGAQPRHAEQEAGSVGHPGSSAKGGLLPHVLGASGKEEGEPGTWRIASHMQVSGCIWSIPEHPLRNTSLYQALGQCHQPEES